MFAPLPTQNRAPSRDRRRLFGLSLLCALVFALSAAPSAAKPAAVGDIHPEVARSAARVARVPAHEAYAALRRLWLAWEIADPAQVEGALSAFATDSSLAPPVRNYAATLEAYARRRRGDLAASVSRLKELGFVSEWLVVGPFDNENRGGLSQTQVVEQELGQPIELDRSFVGKERPVRWRRAPDVHHFGYLDVGAMMRPQRDICAYATTYLRPRDGRPRPATLWIGTTGAFALYFDDRKILEDAGYRELDADRFAATIQLSGGFNRVTVKVCGDESPPAVALRVAGADGAPAPEVEVVASLEASTSAAARARERGPQGDSPRAAGTGVVGPLQRFQELVARAGDKPDAALLAAYAEYLLVTGGDAEASHEARDLASRAAELAPSVERLLLAAKLAEDRNKQRQYVERAAELAKSPAERSDVLLARARVIRGGPNPRDAFELYDDVLRHDAGNVEALLGKVDLYGEAGLPRTALSLLQRASEAQPANVALLRALSGQLRALGRDTEAAEVEQRYAALRFDDGGYLKERLDVAVARRDDVGARRWAARLLEVEPASAWAHGVVARSLLALGDSDGAIATYRRALEVAPEDVGAMQALSDVLGLLGRRDEQLALLQTILRISPQAQSVRAYVEHIEPKAALEDEKLAWPPERFLAERVVTDDEHPLRTLHRLTVTTVFDNGLASHFKQVVFQPLNDEAAAQARQYAFVYHADRQIVRLRAAKVYRRDGRVDEAIESGEGPVDDPSINMYTLQRAFYVQFPRLEPGDVVELRYRVDDVAARNEMADYFGEINYLQSTEPTHQAEYVLVTPKDKQIHISVGPKTAAAARQVKHEVSERDGRRTDRFTLTDVPPLQREPLMPRLPELLVHVHASTFASWQDVGRFYWGLMRDKLDVDDDVRALAKKLVAGLEDDRAKVAAIYRQAATETRYVALEFGIEGIRPRRAALTLARGWGDCKDKATLIVALLREVGIDAEVVLVRTGLRGGFDPTTASLEPFDHAIAYVPSLDLYLDGTAEDTGTDELPALDRGAFALRIAGGEGKLVTLPDADASSSVERRQLEVSVTPGGELRFSGTIETRGVGAPSWRRRYHAEATQRERVASDLAGVFGPVELLPGPRGLRVSDLGAIEKPVQLEVGGAATAAQESGGWVVPVGASLEMVRRYASRPERSQALLLGPRRVYEESWSVKRPAGTEVASAPRPTKLSTPFGQFELTVSEEGPVTKIRTRLELDKSRIGASDYPAWRAFCQAVDASAGARLLISRP